jgi:class 3 adenylate cyclase
MAVHQEQEDFFRQIKWMKNLQLGPIPEEYRYDYAREMFTESFRRMVTGFKIATIIMGVIVILIDVLEIVPIPSVYTSQAVSAHIALLSTLIVGYAIGRRIDPDAPDTKITTLMIWGTTFRTAVTVATYFLLYFIGLSGGSVIGAYAVFLALITAGLYADLNYTLTLALLNAIAYTGVVIGSIGNIARAMEELIPGYALLLIAVSSSDILLRGMQNEYAARKQVEREREKAQDLNRQLGDANEEIQRQIDTLNTQAQEIELSNTMLQNKALELEQERNMLERANQELDIERDKSDGLLLNILPEAIANRLKSGEQRIAERFDCVSVMFVDIVGFTPLANTKSPEELVHLLDQIFSLFDSIASKHGLEKIKTIGDAYMVVGGLPMVRADHAYQTAQTALDMITAIEPFAPDIRVRIGIHAGTVVAGVIGTKKFAYDLWGDTVNIASRMESHGAPGHVHISHEFFEALRPHAPSADIQPRGDIDIKGKGTMATYFLRALRA